MRRRRKGSPTPSHPDLEPVSGGCRALGGKALRTGFEEPSASVEPAGRSLAGRPMEARSADHHPNSETTYGRHQDARNSFTGAARRGRKSDFLLGELIARSEEIQPPRPTTCTRACGPRGCCRRGMCADMKFQMGHTTSHAPWPKVDFSSRRYALAKGRAARRSCAKAAFDNQVWRRRFLHNPRI